MFNKATKQKSKLRLLLEGPSGCGKTYSALTLAKAMGKKVAVIDTEKGSASLYSDRFDFDVCELLPPYNPESYVDAIKGAEASGYDVLIIDSISHEWSGEGGCLDIQSKLGGKYQDWAKVTPRHTKFIEAILQSGCHIVGTVRTKAEYAMVMDGKRAKVEKLGTKTEQRDGLEFEFTTALRLNQNHMFEATKDRTGIFNGKDGVLSELHANELMSWLEDGLSPSQVAAEKLEREENALVDAKTLINDSVTLDDLLTAWLSIPKNMQLKLLSAKDKRKEELDFIAKFPPAPSTQEVAHA